jgi:hypothetical protein
MTVMPRIPEEPGNIDAALAEFFAHCRTGAALSFRLGQNEGLLMEKDEGVLQHWSTHCLLANRFMLTGIALADRLQGRTRQTTHRVIVERVTQPAGGEPQSGDGVVPLQV